MTHAVLFVCAMNVCRSPLMQWAFLDNSSEFDPADFTVSSRGVDAARGDSICNVSANLMQDSEAGLRFAQRHASAPLAPTDLSAPELVIVATLAERAMLARYAPRLRALTFTLREANFLAADAATSSEMAGLRREEERIGAPLPLFGFPSLIHRRRGTISIPQPPWWSRRRQNPLDVPDSHLGPLHTHRAMLQSVRAETRDLVSSIATFAGQHSAT